MSRVLGALILVLGAVAIIQTVRGADAWERGVQQGLTYGDSMRALADSAIAVADSAGRIAAVHEARADSLAALKPRIISQIRRVPVPAECEPYVAPRDTLNEILQAENKNLRYANEAVRLEADMRALALVRTQSIVDSLTVVLHARPTRVGWFRPNIGVGAFAGACMSGPCVGVGVTIGIRLF